MTITRLLIRFHFPAQRLPCADSTTPDGAEPSTSLQSRHLLCHEQHHSQVIFVHAAEQAAKLRKQYCFFALAAPCNVVSGPALRELWQLGRLFALVEELVHRNFEGAGELFKRLDSGNRVSILNARNVATKQSRSFFDCAL